MLPGIATSDSDLIAELLARTGSIPTRARPPRRSRVVLPALQGAFSLVLMDRDRLIGVRDPRGFRPLCLGKLERGGGCWRRRPRPSTSPAPTSSGSSILARCWSSAPTAFLRAPWPAELIDPKLCLFEFVYLARPDSRLYGQEMHGARIRMGELLADQAPVEADMVMGVPDSGIPRPRATPAAAGSAMARAWSRTATSAGPSSSRTRLNGPGGPAQAESAARHHRRQAPGRGGRLHRSGHHHPGHGQDAAGGRGPEVHLRISSPPYRWPCYYGLDTGSRAELIAANLSVGEIEDYLGADSLAYLKLDALKRATGAPGAGFCDACLTGSYPEGVPVTLRQPEPAVTPVG